jgi:hypothetical protein
MASSAVSTLSVVSALSAASGSSAASALSAAPAVPASDADLRALVPFEVKDRAGLGEALATASVNERFLGLALYHSAAIDAEWRSAVQTCRDIAVVTHDGDRNGRQVYHTLIAAGLTRRLAEVARQRHVSEADRLRAELACWAAHTADLALDGERDVADDGLGDGGGKRTKDLEIRKEVCLTCLRAHEPMYEAKRAHLLELEAAHALAVQERRLEAEVRIAALTDAAAARQRLQAAQFAASARVPPVAEAAPDPVPLPPAAARTDDERGQDESSTRSPSCPAYSRSPRALANSRGRRKRAGTRRSPTRPPKRGPRGSPSAMTMMRWL